MDAAAASAGEFTDWAQLWKLSPEELTKMTAKSTFERFPDGRPKVPDALLEKLRTMDMGIEDMVGAARAARFENQYAGSDWKVLNPQKKLIGRAFTVQFMPARPDLTEFIDTRGRLRNQTAIDMLQKDDVVVVDLFGKHQGGTLSETSSPPTCGGQPAPASCSTGRCSTCPILKGAACRPSIAARTPLL